MKKTAAELQQISLRVRRDIVEMIYKAGSGHPGGSLSAVELLVALYFEVLEENGRFFLSNGHICPALYAVMAEKSLIDKSLLSTYTEIGSVLQGHPERGRLKGLPAGRQGIENTSGPLGLGLAQAAGFAAIKKDSFVYCMTSDGEHDEGNHWEAVNFATKYKLSNLIQIVDKNGIQIEGTVEEIMPLGDLRKRYESLDWEVREIDGHDINEIIQTISDLKSQVSSLKPKVILADTIFGKGVSFMEGNPDWHAKAPNEEEYRRATEDLK